MVSDEQRNGVDMEISVSIKKLKEIKHELVKINEEATAKVFEVKQMYKDIQKPVYKYRSDIIKSIPDFWLTVFFSHPAFIEILTVEDEKIFEYLSNLEVEEFKDVRPSYSISLNFNPNPYFEDSKLTKTFSIIGEGTTKITATSIKWKEGMGLQNDASEAKADKRPHAEESFFTWFSGSLFKGEFDDIHDEIADIIIHDLWRNPLSYFNKVAEYEHVLAEYGDKDDEVADTFKDDSWPNPVPDLGNGEGSGVEVDHDEEEGDTGIGLEDDEDGEEQDTGSGMEDDEDGEEEDIGNGSEDDEYVDTGCGTEEDEKMETDY